MNPPSLPLPSRNARREGLRRLTRPLPAMLDAEGNRRAVERLAKARAMVAERKASTLETAIESLLVEEGLKARPGAPASATELSTAGAPSAASGPLPPGKRVVPGL